MKIIALFALATLSFGMPAQAQTPPVEKQNGEWKIKFWHYDAIQRKRAARVEAGNAAGDTIAVHFELPDPDAIAAGESFKTSGILRYETCRSGFDAFRTPVTFDGRNITIEQKFAKEDLAKRCQTPADVSLKLEISLTEADRTLSNIPPTSAELRACTAWPATAVAPERLVGAAARIAGRGAKIQFHPAVRDNPWRLFYVTELVQSGPRLFDDKDGIAWRYGEQVEIQDVVWKYVPSVERGVLRIKRKSDGKVGLIDMADVTLGDPNDCTVASLLYRKVRIAFERAKDAKIIGSDRRWVTDPDIRYGVCGNYQASTVSCQTAAYPKAAFHTGSFSVEMGDLKPVPRIPEPFGPQT